MLTSAEPRAMQEQTRGSCETLPTLFEGTYCSLEIPRRIAARSQHACESLAWTKPNPKEKLLKILENQRRGAKLFGWTPSDGIVSEAVTAA